ncbi:hypothetical protein T484DRAFT_1839943 [Baffinella frigidus]|nr:hypothetical protein T484DRAFT_1839943 [Cryptophyta sp. CCMP2293]
MPRSTEAAQAEPEVRSTRSTPRKAAAAGKAPASASKSRASTGRSTPPAAAGEKRKLEAPVRGGSKRAAAGSASPAKATLVEVKEEEVDEEVADLAKRGGGKTAGKQKKEVKQEPEQEADAVEAVVTQVTASGKGRARPKRGASALRGSRAAKPGQAVQVKEEPDGEQQEEEDDEDEGEVEETEYEAMRRANIARNREILMSLDIPELPVRNRTGELGRSRLPARGLGGGAKKASADRPPPREKSMRLQGMTSEGEKLPDNWREPLRFKPSEVRFPSVDIHARA